jgi:hypothetical protein
MPRKSVARFDMQVLFLIFAAYLMVAAPSVSQAASGAEIDAAVDVALHSFESQIPGARELAIKSAELPRLVVIR